MNMSTMMNKALLGACVVPAVLVIVILALPVSVEAGTTESDWGWIEAMVGTVSTAQTAEGDQDGSLYSPYFSQLRIVGRAAQRHDDRGVYAAMNRFMDMLERRENGFDPVLADWLFDYCMTVTPSKFHDVSRHIRKIMMDDDRSGNRQSQPALS